MPRRNNECRCCKCTPTWEAGTIETSGVVQFDSQGVISCTYELEMAFPSTNLSDGTYDVLWGCDPDDPTDGGIRLRIVRTMSAVDEDNFTSSVLAGTSDDAYACSWKLSLSHVGGETFEETTIVGFPGVAGWDRINPTNGDIVSVNYRIRVAFKTAGDDVSVSVFFLVGLVEPFFPTDTPYGAFSNSPFNNTGSQAQEAFRKESQAEIEEAGWSPGIGFGQLETASVQVIGSAGSEITVTPPGVAHYFGTIPITEDKRGRVVQSTAPVNVAFTHRKPGDTSIATFPETVSVACTSPSYVEPEVSHVQANACGRTIAIGHFPYGKPDTDYTGLKVSFHGPIDWLNGSYELSDQSEQGDHLSQGTYWFSGDYEREGSFSNFLGNNFSFMLKRLEMFASVRARRGTPCTQTHGGTDWGVSIWLSVRLLLEPREQLIPFQLIPYPFNPSRFMGLPWKLTNTEINPDQPLFSGDRADQFLSGEEVFANGLDNGNYSDPNLIGTYATFTAGSPVMLLFGMHTGFQLLE